jgi:hypothetical protein
MPTQQESAFLLGHDLSGKPLSNKQEALSSNPNTAKKKERFFLK